MRSRVKRYAPIRCQFYATTTQAEPCGKPAIALYDFGEHDSLALQGMCAEHDPTMLASLEEEGFTPVSLET